jgi:SAM-dependent methyltransferase
MMPGPEGPRAGEEVGPQVSLQLALPFSTISHADWVLSVHAWLQHGVPLLAEQAPRACPACGSDSRWPLFVSYDGYPFSECLDCGCWYVARQVDHAMFDRFFELCPAAHEIARKAFEKRASEENLSLDLRRIGAYLDTLITATGRVPGVLRYLDVGAGTGASLIAARDRGMAAIGVEVDPRALEIARSRGLDMRQDLSDGPFELISLWESLEHVSDPLAILRAAHELLAAGGLLAMTVPNRDSPMAALMRGDCSFLGGGTEGPGHINMYGSAQLERLFERTGFELVYLDGQYASNLLELAGYALGRHRGASSLLEAQRTEYNLSTPLATVLSGAGPAIALFEREARLAPVLFAVAARKSDLQAVAPVAARLAERLKISLAEQTTALSRGLEALEAEVSRRDEIIRTLQGEVNLRDEMLQRLQATANQLESRANELQAGLDQMQREAAKPTKKLRWWR